MPRDSGRGVVRPYMYALGAAAVLSALFLVKNVDLRVYWYGVNGFFSGTRPAYGPNSGLGFPMEYRYPPVTYLILFPLSKMSLRVAGILWTLGAWAASAGAVWLGLRVRGLRFDGASIVACSAFMAAYVVLAIRYANVQPFVIAAIFAALILSETQPIAAGILLALGITFKIWPILFLPLLFWRARRRAAIFTVISLVVLWMFPLAIFGAARYGWLLKEWYAAVGRVGATYSEFYYFPGQSLRGVLLRYLTPVVPPLNSFPAIHVFSFSPESAVVTWGIVSLVVYCFFVVLMLRSDARRLWAWDGMAFVLYSLLEPYGVKSGLISLGPAALTAGCLFTIGRRKDRRANGLFLGACMLSVLGAIIQYKPWQRFLLAAGLDFWTEILLLSAFVVWILYTRVPESLTSSRLGADGADATSSGGSSTSSATGVSASSM